MNKINKKGQVLGNLGELGIGIAALAIILTVAFLIISEGQDQAVAIETNYCSGLDAATQGFAFNTTSNDCGNITTQGVRANLSNAYNATVTMQTSTGDIPGWVSLIVVAVVGALLLGLVNQFRKQ